MKRSRLVEFDSSKNNSDLKKQKSDNVRSLSSCSNIPQDLTKYLLEYTGEWDYDDLVDSYIDNIYPNWYKIIVLMLADTDESNIRIKEMIKNIIIEDERKQLDINKILDIFINTTINYLKTIIECGYDTPEIITDIIGKYPKSISNQQINNIDNIINKYNIDFNNSIILVGGLRGTKKLNISDNKIKINTMLSLSLSLDTACRFADTKKNEEKILLVLIIEKSKLQKTDEDDDYNKFKYIPLFTDNDKEMEILLAPSELQLLGDIEKCKYNYNNLDLYGNYTNEIKSIEVSQYICKFDKHIWYDKNIDYLENKLKEKKSKILNLNGGKNKTNLRKKRTKLSKKRTKFSKKRTKLRKKRTKLRKKRTKLRKSN
tara:strand:- start:753 stop:1868 length:1116 start_codon:yes stop_codon:yes gene_type:complete